MSTVPRVELRIPISPTPAYLLMVRTLWASLQRFGGPLAKSADIVLSVSAEPDLVGMERAFDWAPRGRIRFRWVDSELFAKWRYDATGLDRYFVESSADIVGMLDADLLVAGDFDQVLLKALQEDRHLGCIAHVSPFSDPSFASKPSREWWGAIYAEAGLAPPKFEHIHTGWGLMSADPAHRECPPYFNYGVVFSPRQHCELIGRSFVEELETVDRVLETWFKSQIALTLAIERCCISSGTIGFRYNFPMHVPPAEFRRLNPDPDGQERDEDIRIFHYLGHGEVSKGDFDSLERVRQAALRPGLSGPGRIFQKKLVEALESEGLWEAQR